jgi:hypothetical protein
MKKTLLATSAIVGAAMLAPAAFAGTPAVSDNLTVRISGNIRFSVFVFDQDISRDGRAHRGYRFATDESEITFNADGVADNGLEYGFEVQVQTQTDDVTNADRTFGYVGGAWGRLELGDTNDPADDMIVSASRGVAAGRGGFDGPFGDVYDCFGEVNCGPTVSATGDTSKINYYTPRFFGSTPDNGIQVGLNWTPDTGQNGGSGQSDHDATDFEDVYVIGVNWREEFSGFGILLSGAYSGGNPEATGFEDLEMWSVGGILSYAGFQFGGGWTDRGESGTPIGGAGSPGLGDDIGEWWDAGISYGTGPWKVSFTYWEATDDGAAGVADSEMEIQGITFGASYNVAPGLDLAADLDFIEGSNLSNDPTLDNDGTVFVLSTIFSF